MTDDQGTPFKTASPPCNGWYDVKWEDGDPWCFAWLVRVPDEPQDETPEHDVERWCCRNSPNDSSESVCLDIAEPLEIRWRKYTGLTNFPVEDKPK